MTPRFVLLASVAAAIAALSACSSVPSRNATLDQARSRYDVAQANPQVTALAADELKRADLALRTAQQALGDGQALAQVDHLAYLANQRVTIALEAASGRASQAVTAGAAAERDQMRLALRTREADLAQQRLGVEQQSNARKATELAMAEQANARKTAELAQSQQANERKTAELAAADAAAQLDKARVARRDARVSDLEAQLKDLNAKKTDRGMVVTLGDVLFDTGHWKLLPEGSRNMVKLAEVFRRDPQRRALIEGFTDSVGSTTANYELSERRANAVMGELVKLGVAADHLSTRAHGADDPAASNATAAGRQLNRRVEIVFTPLGDEVTLR